MSKRKNNSNNAVSNSEEDDLVVIALDDPRLTDDQRKRLYEIGSNLYGKPDWNIEDLAHRNRKPRDIENECLELKDSVRRLEKARERADAIIAVLQDDAMNDYKLNQFIGNIQIDFYTLMHIVNFAIKSNATERARFNAKLKLANDPKQQEKSFIFDCWQSWQEKPDSYKSKAAFAKDMLTKCEHLASQKKIEDWCREWEKANPAG